MARSIEIQAHDGGRFTGYLAEPAGGKGPGILVIQEIFGVNKVMRDICDGLAKQGYVALCPDLFWRQEPGIDITDKTKAEWDKAFALFNGFNLDKGIDDLKASLSVLRKLPGCSGKVGTVGYCLGGRLAYLMACRSDVDAAVGYYGVMLKDHLAEAKNIRKPLLLHCATEDKFVPKDAQATIAAELKKYPLVTRLDYQGNDHAFARVGGEHYDKAAADLANSRTAEFFKKHLA
ncbi:dienelactone hydrolase family protein [Ferrovibrio sp.]|jgi:carboxymethylenebutenolidase|uniref:dienelactone hydrolase family protein n=1 Tax=Ferrovibrio sp. TaxID=1917215 RepID=UPI0035AD95B0